MYVKEIFNLIKKNIYHWSFRWSFVVKPYENFEDAPQDWNVRTNQCHTMHSAKLGNHRCFFESSSSWFSSVLSFLKIFSRLSTPLARFFLVKNERVRKKELAYLLSNFNYWGPDLVVEAEKWDLSFFLKNGLFSCSFSKHSKTSKSRAIKTIKYDWID